MRRIVLIVALALTGLTLTSSDAFAGKKEKAPAGEAKPLPKIEKIGIAEFDDVFMKARAIHDNLDEQDLKLKEARTNVNTVLGVATDAPLATAFQDLKTAANGKFKIVLKGTAPKLEASDAVPENVQKGLDAANGLVDVVVGTIAEGKKLEPQAKELAGAVVAFPGQLSGMGLDPMKLLAATKIVTANVKATGSTPDRIVQLLKSCEGIFTDLKGVFGA